MRSDILEKLYANEVFLEYLRYHPKWYYYLEQNPGNYVIFENKVKQELKLTTYDKLEKMKKQINFASKMINYFKSKD